MPVVLEYQAIFLMSLLIMAATLSVLGMMGIFIGVFPMHEEDEDDDPS